MARKVVAPTRSELNKAGVIELRVIKYFEDLDRFTDESVGDELDLSSRVTMQESLINLIKAESSRMNQLIMDNYNIREKKLIAKIRNLEKLIIDIENRVS